MTEPAFPSDCLSSTTDPAYVERLETIGNRWWKRLLDVQRPYRWHLRSLDPGRMLDLGCGVGRNLQHLRDPALGVGIDHNPHAVKRCRERGLIAYLPDEFLAAVGPRPDVFDTILCAHVAEHMRFHEARALLIRFLPFLRPGGRVVLIAPQEAGQKSDPTHVEFLNLAALHQLARAVGVVPEKTYSFPFPRPIGHWFKHNESVVIARKP